MNNSFPTRTQAIEILRQSGCSKTVIKHCEAVAKLANETAVICKNKGYNVNLDLVEIGALLHDIGRSKTHTVNHAVVGAEMVKALGLPESVVQVVKRHVGGGITEKEAKELGWPADNYVPITLEEKIISYADKLVETSERIPIEATINKLRSEKKIAAAERVRNLYDEIAHIVGESN